MRFPAVIKNRRRVIVLLGFYLIASGIFVIFHKRDSFDVYRNVGTIRTGTDRLNANDVKRSFTSQKHFSPSIDTANVCFDEDITPLDDTLKLLLDEKHMLQYFKVGNKFFLSKPKWQNNLLNTKNRQAGTNDTKYFISSILRVRLYSEDKAKWTIRELKQWLHYQFFAGTQHVYICIHYLNESERFDSHLAEYIKHGLVSIIWWNKIRAVPGTRTYDGDSIKNQISCYNYILDNFRNESIWHYNFDMDENPYVPNDRCEGFLTRYLKNLSKDVSELRLANYVLQGQCDRSRDIFYDRINRITPNVLNGNVKPIYKVPMTKQAGMHGSQTKGKLVYPDHKDLIMLHYWGARIQKWQNDTAELYGRTKEFNTVRDSLAINIRHSLIAFGEYDAFATNTGP